MRSDIDKADPFVEVLTETHAVLRFESWGELLELVTRPTTLPGEDRGSILCAPSFTQTPSFDAAIQLARDGGWEKGEKLTGEYSKALFDAVSGQIERITYPYDVTGENLDVARFLEGEPECWSHPEVTLNEGYGRRIVRVVFNCAVSGAIGVDTIIHKGAAVAALVQLLEFAGHGVEVILADGTRAKGSRPETATAYVKLKSADQPIDMPRLVFAMAHPSMPRRLVFSLLEHLPRGLREAIGVSMHRGYGNPAGIPLSEQGDVYVAQSTYGDVQWSDPEKARAWVLDILEAQGVVLNRAALA